MMSPESLATSSPTAAAEFPEAEGPAVVVTCADDSRTPEEEEVVRRRGKQIIAKAVCCCLFNSKSNLRSYDELIRTKSQSCDATGKKRRGKKSGKDALREPEKEVHGFPEPGETQVRVTGDSTVRFKSIPFEIP